MLISMFRENPHLPPPRPPYSAFHGSGLVVYDSLVQTDQFYHSALYTGRLYTLKLLADLPQPV